MKKDPTLKPAAELARHDRRFPGEDPAYREARQALLVEEIELRRHIERVAAIRRALPPGGQVPEDYRFEGPDGPITLSELFGDKSTLVTYNWMFGPKRDRPCPMCTSLLSSLDGVVPDLLQRAAFAVIARSPLAKMQAFARERGWRNLPLISSAGNDFNRAYAFEDPDGDDSAAMNAFVKRDGVVRHFWAQEMGPESMDPGQDPRGAPDAGAIWNLLDMTPEGRGDFRPSLEYGPKGPAK